MEKLLGKIIFVIEQLLKIMILVSLVIVLVQVFTRYILNAPLMWTEQACRYMFVWMMLLGMPVAFYHRRYMNFDTLIEALPYRARSIMYIIVKLGMCVFAVCWFIGAALLISSTYSKYTSGLRIPYYCLYGGQNVASLLMFWVMAKQTVDDIKHLAKTWKSGEVAE